MAHLRRLGIQNFRSIEKANLKLGEITVVIGPSDVGKSNLARALKAWAYNALSSGFTTEGKAVCRVAVAIGRRHKVVFEKAEQGSAKHGRTRYVLDDAESGSAPLSFEKVGRTVPQEVVDVTKIRPIVVDDLKVTVHFAGQSEPWFLLQSPPWTPAATSKIIGRVSGIDPLILANRDLVNKRNRLSGEIKTLTARADEQRGRLDEFDGLDQLAVLLARAEETWSRLEANRKTLVTTMRLLERARAKQASLRLSRARVGKLSEVLEHVHRSEIEVKLGVLGEALELDARVDSLEARRVRVSNRAGRARKLLKTHAEALAALAGDEGLECPLCGEGAHEGCREALARAAREVIGG